MEILGIKTFIVDLFTLAKQSGIIIHYEWCHYVQKGFTITVIWSTFIVLLRIVMNDLQMLKPKTIV